MPSVLQVLEVSLSPSQTEFNDLLQDVSSQEKVGYIVLNQVGHSIIHTPNKLGALVPLLAGHEA